LTDSNCSAVTIEAYVDQMPFEFISAIKWNTGTPPSNGTKIGAPAMPA